MKTGSCLFSVVVLSHNRLEDLQNNLQTWLYPEIIDSKFEIIVIDNASSDGSAQFLDELQTKGKIKAILNEKNVGVAAGRNAGFRVAQGEIVICLDDDAYLSPAYLGKIKSYFDRYPDLGALSLAVVHAVTGEPQNAHGNAIVEVANYHGAAHAFSIKALQEISYLDEECFFGGEEFDSCVRLHDKGYRCLYTPEIVAKHNSCLRQGGIGLGRSCQWAYNYARILFKNFPYDVATLYANRLLIARILNSIARFGVAGTFQIIEAEQRGRRRGKMQHQCVSARTIEFYSNPALRPEFGNVPLMVKMRNRVLGHG